MSDRISSFGWGGCELQRHLSIQQRNLPFWLAVLVRQLLVLFIPVVGLLYPLLRISPRIFVWIESRRVYGFYAELKLLEGELASASSDKASKDFIERLDQLED
jgi:hypothetical protein